MTATSMGSTFILADPELYLPDRDAPALAHAEKIILIGSFQTEVRSAAELLRVRSTIETALASEVTLAQQAIEPPAYVVRDWQTAANETLVLYGQIFTPDEAAAAERAAGGDEAEADLVRLRVADALSRGWFFGRFFSPIEPTGETGCWHRAHVDHVVTADEFEMARVEGWPS